MTDLFGQGEYGIRFDWGLVGAQATQSAVVVVVDVLSFSTAVTVAVERGMRVYPYPWKGSEAQAFAAEHRAVVAVGRRESSGEGHAPVPSLSPASLLECVPVPRLVLPSPNGSTISADLQQCGAIVAVGCLRTAGAAAWGLPPVVSSGPRPVGVNAAGSRWPHDDSLRPALEDHLGAGAILSSLVALGLGEAMSPEARSTADLFDAAQESLEQRLHSCVGGRELVSVGFASDLDVAGDQNASNVVPVLADDGAFASTP
ncbi:MAG: 2-phosphosulfolactate phosphatase [Microthrixaceae bacterium]